MIFPLVNDVKHRAFCGPTAIALLTGVPVSVIEQKLRRGRKGWGNKPIKGCYNWEVLRVLKTLGCKVEEFKNPEGTFAKFVEDTTTISKPFLVNVTGHYMVSHKGQFADSAWIIPTPISDYDRAYRRVKKAWVVSAPALPRITLDSALAAKREPAPKPKVDLQAKRAAKVAADIKRWTRKEKLAKTKLKKLKAQARRYEKLGVTV